MDIAIARTWSLWLSSLALVLGLQTLVPSQVAALTTQDAYVNSEGCATIGVTQVDENDFEPAICWMNQSGTETLVELPNDGNGTLNDDVLIRLTNPYGNVARMAPKSSWSPSTSCDCGTTWSPIVYGGNYLNISSIYASADDQIDGAVGSGNTTINAGGSDDIIYNYSSIGELYGEAGGDDVVSDSTGSNDVLEGGSGVDCLWDTSEMFETCDCGGQTGDTRHTSHSCDNCDSTSSCCGLC